VAGEESAFRDPPMSKIYCVYILASRSRSLYTGVTNNLERRMIEHRDGLIPGFTSQYRNFRLVHFEPFRNIREAIAREKEIKGWRREKKLDLIQQRNPTWEDLAAQLPHHFHSFRPQKQIPPRSPNTGDRVRDDNARGNTDAKPYAIECNSANAKPHVSFRTK
jgi:putative endonuclease